ncbi:hypothetical protein VTG60DRAFT_230 [Thermothelomyces hinnuleus]
MHRHSERRHSAAWAGPEQGYRSPTPYPVFDKSKLRSCYYKIPPADSRARHRYIDTACYQYSKELQQQIDKQNARIARRPPHVQGCYFELERSAPKRVRFLLPGLRRDRDERDDLAREFAKLSIQDPYVGPDGRRCSRCERSGSGAGTRQLNLQCIDFLQDST